MEPPTEVDVGFDRRVVVGVTEHRPSAVKMDVASVLDADGVSIGGGGI